jgi:hypothetical protein
MSTILINPFILFPAAAGGATDPDAAAYIAAVEAEDGDVLEAGVVTAIDNFVIGCKADGIWAAIKASCIMAGARTLDGALTPLVGAAPTNVGPFVSGDYNRKTGLVGNGSTKYLGSNRSNNADPQNSNHNAVYATTVGTNALLGPSTNILGRNSISPTATRNRSNTGDTGFSVVAGFTGTSRSSSANYTRRTGGSNATVTRTSETMDAGDVQIFAFDSVAGNHRIAFYSIGEALDLALLDARVSTLMADIAAAIP